MPDRAELRDAATLIAIRDPAGRPQVLMGQRGANAAFMPSRFVFPGGAVDPEDCDIAAAGELNRLDAERLERDQIVARPARAFGVAAIRELWEETGLRLGRPARGGGDLPASWRRFGAGRIMPDLAPLHFVFRAITPPGRPRRFDARFFVMDASAIHGDPDDFSDATDELSHLEWIGLDRVGDYELPFVTQVVLAEVAEMLPSVASPGMVPFFDNRGAAGRLIRL